MKKINLFFIVAISFFPILAPTAEAREMSGTTTLSSKQQAIVPIAAFTAAGKTDRLKTALNDGLDAGLTVNEIKEVLVQMYAYTGFPRSLNGLETFMTVMKERQEKGIKDEIGKEASSLPTDKTPLELGTIVQTQLAGTPVKGSLFDFAPAIDEYLKTHLFGDIFARDVLDFQQREIATIAALSSLDGVESQLQSHFRIGMNVGLTETQLRDLISVLETKVGAKEADRAKTTLNTLLSVKEKTDMNEKTVEQEVVIVRPDRRKPAFGEEKTFTGKVRREALFAGAEKSHVASGFVTFEPGARTAWHTHPRGQMLVVTEGEGRVQKWGGPIQEIKAGDVVWFPADMKHWHGAAATTAMTHIAITETEDGSAVQWLEHVTDEQYNQSENQ